MLINSAFGRTFLFLTKLAWKNRVALPALIMVGCMVLNYRGEIEINIHTERIALHDLPNHRHHQQQGGAFAGIAIDHLEDYSDEDEEDEEGADDLYNYDESDDDEDDEFFSYDEDDGDDDTYDDEDDEDGPLGDRMLNGTIRLNWYTTLNIHNARR
ncbi:probable DNA-directed RNA polymerase subunit delta [Anopheles maculipalpis]|uniref:probable DNA-directed RNA polymerase subunit delta n=1 Tax=Anopheles maculipalpis TaxID=1496333 RepID=UPI002158E581|nr:probable DNA-directed RNA polymerase subunit delta [Anopheles maculipalpis]